MSNQGKYIHTQKFMTTVQSSTNNIKKSGKRYDKIYLNKTEYLIVRPIVSVKEQRNFQRENKRLLIKPASKRRCMMVNTKSCVGVALKGYKGVYHKFAEAPCQCSQCEALKVVKESLMHPGVYGFFTESHQESETKQKIKHASRHQNSHNKVMLSATSLQKLDAVLKSLFDKVNSLERKIMLQNSLSKKYSFTNSYSKSTQCPDNESRGFTANHYYDKKHEKKKTKDKNSFSSNICDRPSLYHKTWSFEPSLKIIEKKNKLKQTSHLVKLKNLLTESNTFLNELKDHDLSPEEYNKITKIAKDLHSRNFHMISSSRSDFTKIKTAFEKPCNTDKNIIETNFKNNTLGCIKNKFEKQSNNEKVKNVPKHKEKTDFNNKFKPLFCKPELGKKNLCNCETYSNIDSFLEKIKRNKTSKNKEDIKKQEKCPVESICDKSKYFKKNSSDVCLDKNDKTLGSTSQSQEKTDTLLSKHPQFEHKTSTGIVDKSLDDCDIRLKKGNFLNAANNKRSISKISQFGKAIINDNDNLIINNNVKSKIQKKDDTQMTNYKKEVSNDSSETLTIISNRTGDTRTSKSCTLERRGELIENLEKITEDIMKSLDKIEQNCETQTSQPCMSKSNNFQKHIKLKKTNLYRINKIEETSTKSKSTDIEISIPSSVFSKDTNTSENKSIESSAPCRFPKKVIQEHNLENIRELSASLTDKIAYSSNSTTSKIPIRIKSNLRVTYNVNEPKSSKSKPHKTKTFVKYNGNIAKNKLYHKSLIPLKTSKRDLASGIFK